MELKHLTVNDESIGGAFKHYIQSAVERVMDNLLEKGFTERELVYAQDFITWWVINDAEDILSNGLDSKAITDISDNVYFQRQFKEEIMPNRDSAVERLYQAIVPEDKWEDYTYIIEDMENAGMPFTDENITKMIKERHKI